VIDILEAPRLAGGIRHGAEILLSYLDNNDPFVLLDYGDRIGNSAVFKRLGYIAETLDGDDDLIAACHDRISAGVSLLDPDVTRTGRTVTRWNLRINTALA
jgi:predicted transcriptional regulator of viral defense system